MFRFVVVLVVSAFLMGLLWPHLRKFRALRPAGAAAERKGQKFFLIFTASVVLTMVITTLMWWFGH